eukprot:GEMP01056368.1.p1 GENE.GEMP01056368.1~~GEMP01056368.1.p1  ORF type:complete len:158 (+),score=43.37 GEMP01056368.1:324-797(+)
MKPLDKAVLHDWLRDNVVVTRGKPRNKNITALQLSRIIGHTAWGDSFDEKARLKLTESFLEEKTSVPATGMSAEELSKLNVRKQEDQQEAWNLMTTTRSADVDAESLKALLTTFGGDLSKREVADWLRYSEENQRDFDVAYLAFQSCRSVIADAAKK